MQGTQRTESDQISMSPVVVTFGKKEYELAILSINAQRKWRRKTLDSFMEIATILDKDVIDRDAFYASMAAGWMEFPEKVAEVVFTYDSSLPREIIEEEGSEEQMSIAFAQVVAVGFPSARHLLLVNQVVSVVRAYAQKAKFTN